MRAEGASVIAKASRLARRMERRGPEPRDGYVKGAPTVQQRQVRKAEVPKAAPKAEPRSDRPKATAKAAPKPREVSGPRAEALARQTASAIQTPGAAKGVHRPDPQRVAEISNMSAP